VSANPPVARPANGPAAARPAASTSVRVQGGLDLERFIRERRSRWARFESLLDDLDRLPDRGMGEGPLLELVRLYRQTCSDLNEARSYTANAELLTRLNELTGRGYRVVYRRSHGRRFREDARRFFVSGAPAAFRREQGFVLAAAAAFLLGAGVGLGAVLLDRENGERLIPEQFFSESPARRVEAIEKNDERIGSLEDASAFGSFLFTHNIQVTFLAFSLGALTLAGGAVILFYNGVILGAVAALYYLDGVHVFFMAWVGPHGALELPAIVFGGAAGLRLGHALLRPGPLSTGESVRRALPSVWPMLLATCLVLVAAGLIEGSFSQFSAKTVPYGLKIAAAGALFTALFAYLFLKRLGPEEP
jgi:uncharacterized membrane protein SpoIIM required for sporulation